eukprot:5495715-Ditylum_brightwellii.AAC.1
MEMMVESCVSAVDETEYTECRGAFQQLLSLSFVTGALSSLLMVSMLPLSMVSKAFATSPVFSVGASLKLLQGCWSVVTRLKSSKEKIPRNSRSSSNHAIASSFLQLPVQICQTLFGSLSTNLNRHDKLSVVVIVSSQQWREVLEQKPSTNTSKLISLKPIINIETVSQ